ncbi:PQQ-dependent sugar dehydrogenase [Aromatoleum toluvorans]|uniref:PQQ-dependent sugar dehydrogenase n=1 Tax=Aromatoleum toluvorans TaxID=92002 RepID=A0ABX1PVI9_9RHOO|nr:PQQ-dependent sugar dehydrogenase [Aromatoleum toluvorans]NMG42727.1 PQQ-dependent sugar dehydrogenase [Aromatoleum toluvorans]
MHRFSSSPPTAPGVRAGRWGRWRGCVATCSLIAFFGLPPVAEAQTVVRSEAGPVRVTEVARGLETPWSLAFLPDGNMLVTERPGRLRIVSPDGKLSAPILNVPRVHAAGQGGLLDVVIGPNFARDRLIWLSFAQPTSKGARTAVARARLDDTARSLQNVEVVFAQREDPDGRNHWGSRLVFDRDGNLFVTLGDRFSHRDSAQDLASHLGKIVRIRPDGGIPPDNPFVGKAGAQPEIWSWGHRNVQGAALHPVTGKLWAHEHGPQGGDEVNVVRAGGNYGWPVITYGKEYVTGFSIGEGTERADVVPPVRVWIPSIAPSGMTFYTGDAFPKWKGSLFVGALRGQLLARLELDGEKVVREERLLTELGKRIRDVRQGPDGKLYLLDETDGRILRLDPG